MSTEFHSTTTDEFAFLRFAGSTEGRAWRLAAAQIDGGYRPPVRYWTGWRVARYVVAPSLAGFVTGWIVSVLW